MKRRKLLPKPTLRTNSNSGIVLFAKRPGRTSFSSLYTIKKALKTNKVGHTGTLDSFASGLLVVCIGSLTRLASKITAFDKTYEAVIHFGKETDTLDPTGNIIKTTSLPTFNSFKEALEKFKGELLQSPPAFSALHVDGKRASDLARKGQDVSLPKRPVTVYENQIKEILFEDGTYYLPGNFDGTKKVLYARIHFEVSKGTYIRSLARDIGEACKSCAHLAALRRTRVGNFVLEESAGYNLLPAFNIKNVISFLGDREDTDGIEQQKDQTIKQNQDIDYSDIDHSVEQKLQEEILDKIKGMTPDFALDCGFRPVTIIEKNEFSFFNGKPLKTSFFKNFEEALASDSLSYAACALNAGSANANVQLAVFDSQNEFCGIVNYTNGKLSYGYVVPRKNSVK